MTNRILELNKKLEASRGKSLSVVIMLGDPDLETTFELIQIAVDQGVDVVELGIPSANPFLDSGGMHESMGRALAWSNDPFSYLDALSEVRRKYPALPVEVMIYRDTLEQIGLDAYCKALHDAEADATLVADIADQDAPYRIRLDSTLLEQDIIPIRFVPHPFRPEQIIDLQANARGFIVVQTKKDAGGNREDVLDENQETLAALRDAGIKLPLIFAYGIRTPEHVRKCIELGADGVLIGTAVLETAYRRSREAFESLLGGFRQATTD